MSGNVDRREVPAAYALELVRRCGYAVCSVQTFRSSAGAGIQVVQRFRMLLGPEIVVTEFLPDNGEPADVRSSASIAINAKIEDPAVPPEVPS